MAADLDGSDEPVPGTEYAEPGEEPTSAQDAAPPEERAQPETAGVVGSAAEPEVLADPVPPLTQLRVLTFLAVGPILTGYVAIASLLAVVTALASHARFTTTGVLGAALPSWLAAYQVPVSVLGLELGVLPLLPTIVVVVLIAKTVARATERLDLHRPGQAALVVGAVATAHAAGGLVVAMLVAGEEVTVDPLAAFAHPALVSATAATFGVLCGRVELLAVLARRVDVVAVAGLRAGLLAVVLLLAAGSAVLTFALLTSTAAARDMFPAGAGNAVGMLLLSIGYLPNAVVAATSFLAGPGFSLGTITVSPLEFTGGPPPAVPLLAALPEQQAAWWPVLFLLPLAVGVLVGYLLRDVDEDPVARLHAVGVATGVVAVCFVVLAAHAGGRLGRGTFDPVSMRAAAVSIALVLWTAIPAAVTAWFTGTRPATEPLPGLIDDPEDEDEDEDDEPPAQLPDAVEAARD
ncbi:DUF6350 family protein [Actinophytocola sp.]|uniref:cell division protein PerM n=1 Tax=Actinophytocola sp. TaxID=1872138 RepID=UPI002ED37921